MRRLVRLSMMLWMAATLVASLWVMSQNPFAAPVVARTANEARLALARAVAREVTPEWLLPRLDQALEDEDPDAVELYAVLAADHGILLDPGRLARIESFRAAQSGTLATIAACGACIADIAACRSIALIGACVIPFELSPAGDVAALGRAGTAYVGGTEVDEIEASLAAIGLGATAATLASGGTSASVKVGATALRVARKMGALQPGMLGAVRRAALKGTDGVEELSAIAADFGKLRDKTSTAEALVILRHADDPADLARLGRVADAAGPDTRKTLDVLGKARTFRLLDRVAGITLAMIGLLVLLAQQAALLFGMLMRWVAAPLTRQGHRPRAAR